MAAYAAALEVLTKYATLDGEDVLVELLRPFDSAKKSAIVKLLEEAKKKASDFLIPKALGEVSLDGRASSLKPAEIWADLSAHERFFLKAVELEASGEIRVGAFQEIARGFGIDGYRELMGDVGANSARLKTAREFKARDLRRLGSSEDVEDRNLADFSTSVVRHALFGIYKAMDSEDLRPALQWLSENLPDYWERRKQLLGVLDYLARIRTDARRAEAETALKLAGAVHNDSR